MSWDNSIKSFIFQKNILILLINGFNYWNSNRHFGCLHPRCAFPTFSSVQSLSRVRLFATPWITARQASLSITNSRSLLKLMPIKSVMPSSHLILCRPLLLLPPIPPSIRVFSSESTLWHEVAKVLEFQLQHQSFQWTPRTDLFRMDWLDLLALQGTLRSLLQNHSSKASIFRHSCSSQSNSHIHTWPLEKP